MSLVKFLANESIMEADISLEGHRVQLTFKVPISTITTMIALGFQELNEKNQMVMSDFSKHRYLYHEEVPDHVFIITDDPTDEWHEQPFVPGPPAPEPYIPTLEEIKEMHISELNSIMETMVSEGTDVTLKDGSVEHFTFTVHDQISLASLRALAEAGAEKIPWHTADHSEFCKYYDAEDMLLITDAALSYVTYMVTLFRDERIWIESMDNKEDVLAVTFPQIPPEEYQSDVLKDLIRLHNAN